MIREEKEKEKAIDNISYRITKDKKQEDMMMAKLTKKQKMVLKKKQNLANMMGEPIKVEDIVNDPLFKSIGDKKVQQQKKK